MDKTSEELSHINQTLKEISDKMPKPDHPFIRGMIVVGLAASIFGILQAVEIIVRWIGGIK